jgi:hypothetical protein
VTVVTASPGLFSFFFYFREKKKYQSSPLSLLSPVTGFGPVVTGADDCQR